MSATKRPRSKKSGLRQVVAYGEVPGTALLVDELDDGAMLTMSEPMTTSKSINTTHARLRAPELMKLARGLADLFGHAVISRGADLREKLATIVYKTLANNESRALDDEVDREVVAAELLRALMNLVERS